MMHTSPDTTRDDNPHRMLCMMAGALLCVLVLAGCGQGDTGVQQQAEAPVPAPASQSPEPLPPDSSGAGGLAGARSAPPGWDALPTPGASLSDTPGPEPVAVDAESTDPPAVSAPHLEQVEEAHEPQAVLLTDPNPNPTVTNTPIPPSLVGQQFQGGRAGGPFGVANGNGDFGASVFGSRGNAKDIVFVVDASGSMVDVLPFVVKELKRVVGGLSPEQRVTVICFSGEGVYEVSGGGGDRADRGLREASPAFKEQMKQWLTMENFQYPTGGRGSQHAAGALTQALAYKPQLLFVLSDNLTGGGQGATRHEISQAELVKAIKSANQGDPPAKINTIQFLYEDPLVRAGLKGTLQLLADETGGSYRFIGARDLNLK